MLIFDGHCDTLSRINNPEDLMKTASTGIWSVPGSMEPTYRFWLPLLMIIFAPGLKPLWPATLRRP